jgi:hypothetical protein
MKELLQEAAGLLPAFFDDLTSLLSGPKTFLATRLADDARVRKALVFLGMCAACTFLLKTPLLRLDPWLELGSAAAFTMVSWTSVGLLIFVAWRIVGGRGSLEATLVISYHVSGILEFIQTFTYLGMMGLIRMADPAFYSTLLAAVYEGNILPLNDGLFDNVGARLGFVACSLGVAAVVTWVVAAWGAYRGLHQVNKLRSVAAFVIAVVGSIPLVAITFLLANALVK